MYPKRLSRLQGCSLLAPDWTGSNFLTVKKLATALVGKGANSANDPKVVRQIYGRFWIGIAMKGLIATMAMNLIMAGLGKGV